jgi:hypothetical protein
MEALHCYETVLTNSFPRLDIRLVDGVICDAGVLASITTATKKKKGGRKYAILQLRKQISKPQ